MKAMVILFALLLTEPDEFRAGIEHFRAGRFADAVAAFRNAEKAAGDAAGPELLFNLALAAVRSGDPVLAETAAEKAAARGGAAFEARRDFIHGNAAFLRLDVEEAATDLPNAPPAAFDKAIATAETAFRLWSKAAATVDDWPEARRNAERALEKADELRKKKIARAADPNAAKKERTSKPRPRPEPPRDVKKEEAQRPEQRPAARAAELTPEQTKKLLEKLQQLDREKGAVREREQSARAKGSEKDW